MSRGDEIEEGGPRRDWKPPAGGYDDEADEPRDRDDRAGIKKKHRSGAVTAVGIIAIILGSLNLTCGLCGSASGACLAGGMPFFQDFMKKAAAQDPNLAKDAKLAQGMKDLEKAGPVGYVAIGSGIFGILQGGALIIGGIGVLRRVNFARYLTLASTVLGLLNTCGSAGAIAALGMLELNNGLQSGLGLLVGIAFSVFAFIVLLNGKNVQEFSPSPTV